MNYYIRYFLILIFTRATSWSYRIEKLKNETDSKKQ